MVTASSFLIHQEHRAPFHPASMLPLPTSKRLPAWLGTIVQPPQNERAQANPHASLFTPLDDIYDSSLKEASNFGRYSQAPTWLADEHFDLNAFNSSVMASTLGFFSPGYTMGFSTTTRETSSGSQRGSSAATLVHLCWDTQVWIDHA